MLCTLSSRTHGLTWHCGSIAQQNASKSFGDTPTLALPRFCGYLLGEFSTHQALHVCLSIQSRWLGLEPDAHELRLKVTQHVA